MLLVISHLALRFTISTSPKELDSYLSLNTVVVALPSPGSICLLLVGISEMRQSFAGLQVLLDVSVRGMIESHLTHIKVFAMQCRIGQVYPSLSHNVLELVVVRSVSTQCFLALFKFRWSLDLSQESTGIVSFEIASVSVQSCT